MIERPPRATVFLSGGLLLSLALNCLLVGFVAANWLPWRDGGGRPPALDRPLSFGERMQSLPEAERAKFTAAMRPFQPAIRAARMAAAAANRHFREVLRQDPYDPVATAQALAELRGKTAIVQQRVQEAAAQAFAVLSPQSREQLSRLYWRRPWGVRQ